MGEGVKERSYTADNSKLPGVDAIDDQASQERAAELLQLAAQYKDQADEAADQLDLIRAELTALSIGFGLSGVRDNRIGFYYNGRKSSKRLQVGKLLENGVSPEVISASYVEGDEREDVRIVRFDK
jgi:hypothetical protein